MQPLALPLGGCEARALGRCAHVDEKAEAEAPLGCSGESDLKPGMIDMCAIFCCFCCGLSATQAPILTPTSMLKDCSWSCC